MNRLNKTFNPRILILLGAGLLGVWWWNSRRVSTSSANRSKLYQQKDIPPDTPEQAGTLRNSSTNSMHHSGPRADDKPISKSIEPPLKNSNPGSPLEEILSPESAGEKAFATGNIAFQMFELKTLSANKAPPGPNEAKLFRGLIRDRSDHERYIEMRFDGEKWLVFVGSKKDELTAWPARDVIPFQDDKDLWTMYYENSEGFFLQHFERVNIPELNGNFEVLSGWLTTPATVTHMALVGINDGWPSEALLIQLMPRRPRP